MHYACFVISEALKFRFNRGRTNNISFYRDSAGNEIDLIYQNGADLIPVEIKSSETVTGTLLQGLKKIRPLLPGASASSFLVHGGETQINLENISITSATGLLDQLKGLPGNFFIFEKPYSLPGRGYKSQSPDILLDFLHLKCIFST